MSNSIIENFYSFFSLHVFCYLKSVCFADSLDLFPKEKMAQKYSRHQAEHIPGYKHVEIINKADIAHVDNRVHSVVRQNKELFFSKCLMPSSLGFLCGSVITFDEPNN